MEMEENDFCPECRMRGITSSMKLYRTHYDKGVYLCENGSCLYPVKQLGQVPELKVEEDDWEIKSTRLRKLNLPQQLTENYPSLKEKVVTKVLQYRRMKKDSRAFLSLERKWNQYVQKRKSRGLEENQEITAGFQSDLNPLEPLLNDVVPFIRYFVDSNMGTTEK